jgi:predicted RNA-binding protein YlxR (DUF448 family)
MPKKIPLRMCVACREMKPKKEMLRIVKNAENNVFIDRKGKAEGRGAYICANEQCIKDCLKKKILNKVFEYDIPQEIYAAIKEDFLAKG